MTTEKNSFNEKQKKINKMKNKKPKIKNKKRKEKRMRQTADVVVVEDVDAGEADVGVASL